jgi:hypothetical protein
MHHQEQTRKPPRVDHDGRGVGEFDERLEGRLRHLQPHIDVLDPPHHLDGMRAIDLADRCDRFIEIVGAHSASLRRPGTGRGRKCRSAGRSMHINFAQNG